MKKLFFMWYDKNKKLFWGSTIGLIVAILFLTIGFWRTLLIAICMGCGAFLSQNSEIINPISNFFSNIFNNKNNIDG